MPHNNVTCKGQRHEGLPPLERPACTMKGFSCNVLWEKGMKSIMDEHSLCSFGPIVMRTFVVFPPEASAEFLKQNEKGTTNADIFGGIT